MGSGHTCYGGLYVRSKTLSWLTPYSQCRQLPYRMLERSGQGRFREFAFQLQRRTKACRFGVIYLRHTESGDPAVGWDVTGYATLDDYRNDRQSGFKALPPTAMSCYLYAKE